MNYFSKETSPEDENLLAVEISCHFNDETWNLGEQKIFDLCMKSIKEDDSHGGSAATTLALSADVLRIGSQLLNPVMPEKTSTILNILGASSISLSDTTVGLLEVGSSICEGKSPFPRIVKE